MRCSYPVFGLVVFAAAWLVACHAPAQQVTVSTPLHSLSDSYFERMGTHWGFDWRGIHFRFGGPNMAVPPFGGFDPNAGINGGFAISGNDFNGFFNFSAGQGYRQSLVTQVPSVTLTSGYPGYIADTSISPFVMGFIPVVGAYPTVPYPYGAMAYPGYPEMPTASTLGNPRVQAMLEQIAAGNQDGAGGWPPPPAVEPPLRPPARARAGGAVATGDRNLTGPAAASIPAERDRWAQKLAEAQVSSAGRAVPSVAEARRLYELEKGSQGEDAMVYYERGLTAEEGGKPNVAQIYYRMALKRATGKLREQIQARLKALTSPQGP